MSSNIAKDFSLYPYYVTVVDEYEIKEKIEEETKKIKFQQRKMIAGALFINMI